MIALHDVTFSYGKNPYIEHLSSELADGRITAILGPNGSGKSTLLRLCAGLLKPSAGKITVGNDDISALRGRELAKQLAFLPQSRPVPMITVRSLVENGRYPYLGLSKKLSTSDRDAVEEALELTGMHIHAGREIRTLSGGERQKAYIAMLIAQGAHHLLLDEPTTYLDVNHRMELMELMQRLRAAGKCIAMVLHDIDLAVEYCDTTMVMLNGSIIQTGTADCLSASGALQQAYSVEPIPDSGLRFRRINTTRD